MPNPIRSLLAPVVGTLWVLAGSAMADAQESSRLRPPVHPRRNVEEFPPVEARFVRMTIDRAARAEPCVDELEIYGPEAPEMNLALAEAGTRARASGTLDAYRIHALSHVNDGLYGNARSWICDSQVGGWVELELPATRLIDRIVWSRDREGKFIDRLPVDYRFEVAVRRGEWVEVASSEDRAPPGAAALSNPGLRPGVRHLPWVAASSAGEASAPLRAAGREYVISAWNSAQGLPSNSVTALGWAREGWLWVGTSHGLARFDGDAFTVYGEKDGLPGLSVGAICEDADGTLWVGTLGGGLARWDGRRFHPVATDVSADSRTVIALAADSGGGVWAATFDGLFEVRDGAAVRHSGGPVSDVAGDPDSGDLWFYQEGLWRVRNGESSEVDPAIERSRFSSLDALALGPGGELWFGGANRYVGRLEDGAVEVFAEDAAALASTVWEILPVDGGDVWLGTSGSGLLRLREGELLSVTTDDGLPANSVSALCQDAEGNLWAGTLGGGLARLSPRRVDVIAPRDGLSHPAVMALAENADGTVWIGTNGGGLNRWKDGRVEPFAPSYVLENETIAALVPNVDAGGSGLWIGTAYSGLARLGAEGFEFVTPAGIDVGTSIRALADDRSGGLWIGTPRGLFLLKDDEATVPAGLEAFAGRDVTALTVDRDGSVWIGTGTEGVARRAPGGGLRRWSVADGLPGASIRTLRLDDAGALWAGTSGGLCRWRGETIDTFTTAHGLPDAVVSQILDDGAGHVWLGTNRGVLRVAHASFDAVATGLARILEVLALDVTDGLPSLECAADCHPGGLRLRDGRLCFGSAAGLAVIDPARFTPLPAPPVVIESVAVGDGELLLDPAGKNSAVVAPSAGQSVEIRFTAPSYTAPQRVRFRWMLDGLDDGWSEPSPQRAVSYRHLPPGDYRFRVAASREGGPWSASGESGESGASFALVVPAPWWRSGWAVAGAVVLGAGLVAGVSRFVVRRRMRNRLRQIEQAFIVESERSRIARDIHDTLGANLTRITLHSAVGQSERDRPEAAAEHFQAISATAGELVQSLDGIVWAVNPAHDTLESLARYLMRFAEEFCAAAPVRLRLDVPDELPPVALSSEIRHNILLAAREALNNAIRHAGASEIRLSLGATADTLRIVIEDDGQGFDPAGASGNGLANMWGRLAICGGECKVVSEAGRGTRIVFSLPLSNRPRGARTCATLTLPDIAPNQRS